MAAAAEAVDANLVEVVFSRRVAPRSVHAPDLRITAPFEAASAALEVTSATVDGDVLSVSTSPQVGGRTYAIDITSLRFEEVELADAPASVSFRGFGLAPVTIRLDTNGRTLPASLDALVTLDPVTGRKKPDFARIPMSDSDGDGIFEASTRARISDETYAARAVGANGQEAGALASFTATSTAPVLVLLDPRLPSLPEFDPPTDPNPGDGRTLVRIILDDRPAHALLRPQLRSSVAADGSFDSSLTRVDPVLPVVDKPRVYELLLSVAVDSNRRLDGDTPETYPYLAFLVEGDEDIPQRGVTFVAPDETPQVLVVPIANPSLVAITFRVDAGNAILEPDGRSRGVYPGEGVFLTGEFRDAEDALGRLAADAFSGGERATLEMSKRPDAPTVYEKIIFLPPNRPYGWKVVRCPSGAGCAELNRHVSSSGRAFPTVMKNLVTGNRDAASDSTIAVVDPSDLAHVMLPDGSVLDYSGARVSETGSDSAAPPMLFKQEAPDLVVTVGTTPLITPIYVVGTWRDVNIPGTPLDIIARGDVLSLAEYDYDDGLAGRNPLVRDLDLPVDPGEAPLVPGEPAFSATDGVKDPAARSAADPSRTTLSVAWNGRDLYVATQPATAGQDRFVLVSLDAPSATHASPWAKAGNVASSARTVFLAMEGDGDFSSWFRLDAAGAETRLETHPTGRGSALEGSIELGALGAVSDRVWVAVLTYGTLDGDPLQSAAQNPPGNGDFDVGATELVELDLAQYRAR